MPEGSARCGPGGPETRAERSFKPSPVYPQPSVTLWCPASWAKRLSLYSPPYSPPCSPAYAVHCVSCAIARADSVRIAHNPPMSRSPPSNPPPLEPALGVLELRLMLGLSQVELGALIGCDRYEISRIEHGGPCSRKTRAALRLLHALSACGEILPRD